MYLKVVINDKLKLCHFSSQISRLLVTYLTCLSAQNDIFKLIRVDSSHKTIKKRSKTTHSFYVLKQYQLVLLILKISQLEKLSNTASTRCFQLVGSHSHPLPKYGATSFPIVQSISIRQLVPSLSARFGFFFP